MRSLPRLCTVFLSSFVLSLLSFRFPLSLHTGFGMERPSWMDRDCQDSSAQRALGWPQGAGTEPPGCHRAPQPPRAGGDGQFTARHWDLQVPRSPGGVFPPTQDLPAAAAGAGWALPRGLGGPRLCLSLAGVLAASVRGDGKTGAGLWAGAPTTSPGTPQARATAPCCGRVPHGAACPPGPSPPAPHFTPGLVQ